MITGHISKPALLFKRKKGNQKEGKNEVKEGMPSESKTFFFQGVNISTFSDSNFEVDAITFHNSHISHVKTPSMPLIPLCCLTKGHALHLHCLLGLCLDQQRQTHTNPLQHLANQREIHTSLHMKVSLGKSYILYTMTCVSDQISHELKVLLSRVGILSVPKVSRMKEKKCHDMHDTGTHPHTISVSFLAQFWFHLLTKSNLFTVNFLAYNWFLNYNQLYKFQNP